jgi:hypothetical protein
VHHFSRELTAKVSSDMKDHVQVDSPEGIVETTNRVNEEAGVHIGGITATTIQPKEDFGPTHRHVSTDTFQVTRRTEGLVPPPE